MRDYGHTKNYHSEKAVKARSPGLIEKNIFTVNSLTDLLFQVNWNSHLQDFTKTSNWEIFPISEMSTFHE